SSRSRPSTPSESSATHSPRATARSTPPPPTATRESRSRCGHHVRELTPMTEGGPAMSLARVQFFSISLDGFGTGEPQSLDAPFGHAGERLHEWMFTTRWWNEMVGRPGGSSGIDDAFTQQFTPGIGAEIMGANK